MFFAVKLGRFIVNTHLFLSYKHLSLTAKIGKQEKQSLVGLAPGVVR